MEMKLKFIAVLLIAFALFAATTVQAADAQTTPHNATLTWGAVTPTGATYNVYRSNTSGALSTKVKVASGLTSATYFDANLTANLQYCYQTTSVVPGLAEGLGNAEACGTTGQDNSPTPGPIILIIK
jgi:outer membrane protein W